MKKIVEIEGVKVKVKMFKTLKAANNFINRAKGRRIIYFKAHEYYVTI